MNPTKADKQYWDRLASLGCIACRIDSGGYTISNGEVEPVSIHHIDGRTKPGAHRKVLPLCAGHHQDGTDNDKSRIAVHPYKRRFEARYGSQMALKALCDQLLERAA